MSCEVIEALQEAMCLLGGRWRIVILYCLLSESKRFSDLQRETGISRRMLTVNLRALEEAGLVLRTAYPEVPPRVEYGMTPEGMKLRPLINDLCAWGQKFSNRQSAMPAAPITPLPVE